MKRPNYTRGDCFNPYKVLYSLHTTLSFEVGEYPGGMYMKTFFKKLPWRNTFFMSNWCNDQSKFTASDNKTLIVFSFAIGENIFW